MAAPEIRKHTIDDTATVFFFARVYEDDRASAVAYDRARAKIAARDNTSVFRVRTPDGDRQLLFVLSGTRANAKRAGERVAWGGEEYSPTTGRSPPSVLVCARSPTQTRWTLQRAGAESADWPSERKALAGLYVALAADSASRAVRRRTGSDQPRNTRRARPMR